MNASTIAVRYSYLDQDGGERVSTRQGVDQDEAIEAAVEALGAYSDDEERTWIYADDATRSEWRSPRADMLTLGAALLDGHSLSAVYSVWCARTCAVEVAS